MTYVNCGCGAKYIPDGNWVNIDFNSYSKFLLPNQGKNYELCARGYWHVKRMQGDKEYIYG